MHVDAGPVLLVVPAAHQSLSAGTDAGVTSPRLAANHLAGGCHAPITPALHLLHHDHLRRAVALAGWHGGRAVGADALLEEGGVAAGAGHAEFHGSVVSPLLLLESHLADDTGLVVCCVTLSNGLPPVSALLGRLCSVALHV